jgi:hypothetical protein
LIVYNNVGEEYNALFEMKERLIEVLENLLHNMPKRGGKSKNNKKKNKNKRTLKKRHFHKR